MSGMLPVRWMSPESLSDGLFTPMSDIWSFGVLLYEMITFGSFPFQGLSNNQVLGQVKSGNTLEVPKGIKPQMSLLLRTCWSHAPTKRPTAGEIVELLSNNPRLLSPCIDVPLASVQIERADELEVVTKQRKPVNSVAQKTHLIRNKVQDSSPEDAGYGSGVYSPMNVPISTPDYNKSETAGLRDPLIEDSQWEVDEYCSMQESSSFLSQDRSPDIPTATSSYIPPGYIVLDQDNRSGYYSKYDPNSVSSV